MMPAVRPRNLRSMTAPADTFDLGTLRLTSGEGRSVDLAVRIEPFELAGGAYPTQPDPVPVRLDVARMTGDGYSLRIRFDATLAGACMRCLQSASRDVRVDAREISQPSAGDPELESPYVIDGILDVAGWARDALALALGVPASVLCRADCAGLCPVCGTSLNDAGESHHHDPEPDPRWAKLRELRFE